MNKHSQEPWSVEGLNIYDAHHRHVAAMAYIHNPNVSSENARRVIACVNACAHISIESLEAWSAMKRQGHE